MNFKLALGPTGQGVLCSLLGGNKAGHCEGVLGGERGFYKTGIHHTHAQSRVMHIHIQSFGQVDEGRFCRPIGQALGQASKARHTADQADMPITERKHGGQHGLKHVQSAHVIDALVFEHFIQIKLLCPHGMVMPRAIQHQVNGLTSPHLLSRLHDSHSICGI